jgi:2-dehydro-3-deoxyphosphogluconate aldolase/(4S)-4-hydroxy-2-oxoglutarate aldolase
MLAALGQLPMIPTGGVTPGTAGDWISSGAVAVGMGGALSESSPALVTQTLRDLSAQLRAGSHH